MKTEFDTNRLLFYIGTGLLVIAILEITVLPCLLYRFLPSLLVPTETYTKIVGGIYILAFVTYVFCEKYFVKQIQTILFLFLFYCIFQIVLQQVW